MSVLRNAKDVRVGGAETKAAYFGDQLVWWKDPGRIVVGYHADDFLESLSSEDLSVEWTLTNVDTVNDSAIAANQHGDIFLHEGNNVVKRSMDGSQQWSRSLHSAAQLHPVALADGGCVALSGSPESFDAFRFERFDSGGTSQGHFDVTVGFFSPNHSNYIFVVDSAEEHLFLLTNNEVFKLDLSNGNQAAHANLPNTFYNIALDEDRGRVYVTENNNDYIKVLDAGNLSLIENSPSLSVPENIPGADMRVHPDGDLVMFGQGGRVYKVDPDSWSVAWTVQPGSGDEVAWALDVLPPTGNIAALLFGATSGVDSGVYILDPSNGATLHSRIYPQSEVGRVNMMCATPGRRCGPFRNYHPLL